MEYGYVRFDQENDEFEKLYGQSETDDLRWDQEWQVDDVLHADQEFISLWERQRELSENPTGFIKGVNVELKKIKERKQELRAQAEISLFGKRLEPIGDEDVDRSSVAESPKKVLEKAITQHEACQERFRKEEEEWRKEPPKQYSQEEIDAMVKKWRKESKQLDVWDYLQ